MEWITKQDRVTANQLADHINLSRSTASFRLNRLAELGVLDKEAIGKKIFYKIKNMPNFDASKTASVQTNPDEFA